MKKLLLISLLLFGCHKEKSVTRQMKVNTDAITHVITINGTDINYDFNFEPNVPVKTGDVIHITASTTNATMNVVMYVDALTVLQQQGATQTCNFTYTVK